MNSKMPTKAKVILEKAKLMIDSTPEKSKVLDRWLTLANRQLQKEVARKENKDSYWLIIGASIGLGRRYGKKFKTFIPVKSPVVDRL